MPSGSCRARACVAVRRPRHPASTQSLRRWPGTTKRAASCSVRRSSGDDRNLPATAGTLVDHPLRRQEVGSVTRAVGAAEALRPFQPGQVLTTPVVVGEPTSELGLAARKFGYIHPAPRTSFVFTLCSYSVDTLSAS